MLTGSLLAKAAANGMRTIVVYATQGEAGEARDGLDPATLGDRRRREAVAACAELGVERVEFLGYVDSGMAGRPSNDEPLAFCNAPAESVASEVAGLLGDEELLAIVGYDANGTYGHPDHVQIHGVANALARKLETPWLLDATYHREYLASLPDSDGTLDPTFASSEEDLTHFVQGDEWFRAKMEAVKRHGSQAPPKSSNRQRRGIDGWRIRFGTEWFIARSPIGATQLGALADVLEPKAAWPGPLTPSAGSARQEAD